MTAPAPVVAGPVAAATLDASHTDDGAHRGAAATTSDQFLGGRLSVSQPAAGHRSGVEAVLIAAAAPLRAGEVMADLGAGAGVAALCALARVPAARAVLVEADEAMAALAHANIAANAMTGRADVVCTDLTVRGAAEHAGLANIIDHAVANPPFYDPAASRTSPSKAAAHAAPDDRLDLWLRFAAAVVRPGGTLTMVHRAAALKLVLDAFGRRFGGARVLPVHPRPGQPAGRIIVQGTKGSRAALAVLPGLVLHEARGHGFTPEVEAILRDGSPLQLR